MITNAGARAGDLLVLTKPLGTGIATTGIKRGEASAGLARRVTVSMKRLNAVGHELAKRGLVRAGTDVTGFGLLGHLASMCRASGVSAEIRAADVPTFGREIAKLIEAGCVPGGTRANLETAGAVVTWGEVAEGMKVLLADAQTSGGLLLCVTPRRLDAVRAVLKKHRALSASVVGRITLGRGSCIIVA
jgi:selenide,water dikinase